MAVVQEFVELYSQVVEDISTSCNYKVTQKDIEAWTGQIGKKIPQSNIPKIHKMVAPSSHANNERVSLQAVQANLNSLKELKNLLDSFREKNPSNATKETFVDFLNERFRVITTEDSLGMGDTIEISPSHVRESNDECKKSIRKWLIGGGATVTTLLALAAYYGWLSTAPRAIQILKFDVDVKSEGVKFEGKLIPWQLLRDKASGDPIILQKGDSLVFDFSQAGVIKFGRTRYYDSCSVGGIDFRNLPDSIAKNEEDKQRLREPFLMARKSLIGALIFYLDSNFIYSTDYFKERRLSNFKPIAVTKSEILLNNKTSKYVLGESTPYLYFCVNDVYLHDDEMKFLLENRDSIGKDFSLGRDSAKAMEAFSANKNSWFFDDNERSFHLKITIYRRPI